MTFFPIMSRIVCNYNLATWLQVLLRMLPAYYNHFRAFENTLVTKFYGLHCVKLTGAAQKKVMSRSIESLISNHKKKILMH